jgi:hypothetical protein
LIATGQYIPQLKLNDFGELASTANIEVSSELALAELKENGNFFKLDFPAAMLLPLNGAVPKMKLKVKSSEATTLEVQLRGNIKPFNFSPDVTLFINSYSLVKGEQTIEIDFNHLGVQKGYYFICFMKNEAVELAESNQLISGLMSVFNYQNPIVSNFGTQRPPENIGVETFELWCPIRRPKGKNFALTFDPALEAFPSNNLRTEIFRPVVESNAWVADYSDPNPTITLNWEKTQWIKQIKLFFDTDADHAMENAQWGHFDSAMPFCVREYEITDDNGTMIFSTNTNHQTINTIDFKDSIRTKTLTIKLKHPSELVSAAVFGIIVN